MSFVFVYVEYFVIISRLIVNKMNGTDDCRLYDQMGEWVNE